MDEMNCWTTCVANSNRRLDSIIKSISTLHSSMHPIIEIANAQVCRRTVDLLDVLTMFHQTNIRIHQITHHYALISISRPDWSNITNSWFLVFVKRKSLQENTRSVVCVGLPASIWLSWGIRATEEPSISFINEGVCWSRKYNSMSVWVSTLPSSSK